MTEEVEELEPGEPDGAEVFESIGDAPVDEPPPDEGDAGGEGIAESDGG